MPHHTNMHFKRQCDQPPSDRGKSNHGCRAGNLFPALPATSRFETATAHDDIDTPVTNRRTKPPSRALRRRFSAASLAVLLLAVTLLTGCATYRSTLFSRTSANELTPDTPRPVKGVPIAVKVPTHLDIYIDETYYLTNHGDQYTEKQLVDDDGQPLRNLSVRPQLVETKKIFVVDFKRAAGGVTSNGIEFNEQQYLKRISGQIQDETLNQVTDAFSTIKPLLGRPTSARSSTRELGQAVSGKRTVAFRRFDLDAVDFEERVQGFVDYHLNRCNECAISVGQDPATESLKTEPTGLAAARSNDNDAGTPFRPDVGAYGSRKTALSPSQSATQE